MAKRLMITLACLLVFATAAAEEGRQTETEHLVVKWVEGTPPEAIEAAKDEGEKYYAALHEMLGHEPAMKVTILLQGPGERPDGSRGYPRVNMFGQIELYQFGPTWHSYFSALAHEMVHVFRFRRSPQMDWFFEEGFAEFMALHLDDSLAGFPWFDFPVTVVAGQWIANGEDIPLSAMQANHRAINQPCKAQSYTLRSSFFQYLGKTHGKDAVLKMAAEERSGDLDQYEKYFGADFETLAAQWRKALMAEYESLPDVSEQARRYREESPIQWVPVCEEGKQF